MRTKQNRILTVLASMMAIFSYTECFGQFVFNPNTKDTVFIDEKRVNIKINGQSFVGPILNTLSTTYQREVVLGISANTTGVVNFSGSFINPVSPISIESAKIYEVSPKSVLKKIAQGYFPSSIFSEKYPLFDYSNKQPLDTQVWYSPITFQNYIQKQEKERQMEFEKLRKIQIHDSITQINSFYGVYRVRLLTRGGINIAELNEEGKIYFTENGVSIIDLASLEPTLRCSVNKSSGVQPTKGAFVLNTNKSVYEFGSLILGERTGAVSLMLGKKNSTITFETIEFKRE